MRRSVFVHVGAPAAHASYLQRQLAENDAVLGAAGIAVVPPPASGDGLVAGILGADHPTVVVSDDRLAAVEADDVARLLRSLADHRVHVIYVASDLGSAIVVEWQRHVMSTAQPVSLATWVDELVGGGHPSFWRTYGLSDVLARWTVPSADVHVVVSPTGPDASGELWARFGAVIGAPAGATAVVAPGDGFVGPEVLELLRRVHVQLNDVRTTGAHRLVRDVVAGSGFNRTNLALLPPRHRAWVNRQSSLQQKFLEGSRSEVVGDPADLEVGDEQFGDHASAPDDEAVLATGIQAGAELVERLINGRERRGSVALPRNRARAGSRVPVDRVRRKASRTFGSATSQVRRVRLRVIQGDRRTYYLHIGAPKCGSSYLQSLLWRNRDALMRSGVYVPGRSHADHFHAGTDFRGRPYVTQEPDGPWRGAWDRLIDDAERSGYRKIVISSEFLASAGRAAIGPRLERLADDDVQVVYAVREFAGLLGSVWQQNVRTTRVAPWPEWLDGLARKNGTDWVWTHHNVGRILEGWALDSVDRLHVLVVPRQGSPPVELWRRFGSIVGWRSRTTIGGQRGNESLGYAQAEVLRRLQEALVDVEPRNHRARVTKNLIGDLTLAPMERVDRLVIPERLRPWVEAESQRERDAIGSSSAHVVGDLDELRVDDAKFSADPVRPSMAVMLDAAAAVVARLARTVVREEAAASGEATETGDEPGARR